MNKFFVELKHTVKSCWAMEPIPVPLVTMMPTAACVLMFVQLGWITSSMSIGLVSASIFGIYVALFFGMSLLATLWTMVE